MDTAERFAKYDDDHCTSEEPGSSQLRAFNMLGKKFPENPYIVSAAEHDQIWLQASEEQIASLSDDEIKYLRQNGVSYDSDTESLYMFV